MKILIYVVVFFIYSVLTPFVEDILYNMFSATYGSGTNITALYCGLCGTLFAVSAYLCARRLCKLWEKKQSTKAQRNSHAEVASEAIEPEPEITEPSPAITDPTSPAPSTPKLRFCKHCGSPIDPATRKCTGCGKQYFRPPVLRKKYLFIAAGVLACAAVVVLMVNLTSQKNAALSQVDELTARISQLEDTVAEKERQIEVYKRNEDAYQVKLARKTEEYDKLREENTMYKDFISFYEEYVACVGDTGDMIYHRFPCPYMEMDNNWDIFSVPYAKSRGYTPCPYCRG